MAQDQTYLKNLNQKKPFQYFSHIRTRMILEYGNHGV